jgi:hypothetical protein
MSDDHEDRLEELSDLSRELSPPAELEERVITALRERGLIRKDTHRRWWQVAAVIMFTTAGFLAGWLMRPNGDSQAEYSHLLLLWERQTSGGHHDPALVQEYSEWAKKIGREGIPITGEKLTNDSQILTSYLRSWNKNETIAGFFLFRAKNDADALKRAESCPHLKHGGTIELRKIEH